MSKASPILIKQKGDLKKTTGFLGKRHIKQIAKVLEMLGQKGVEALSAATPVRTGKTAASWRYIVAQNDKQVSIHWVNDNETSKGDNIVTLLVRGHGTRDGHYVRGKDFVTPAIEPIMNEIADEAWREVTRR